jgi:hypothetical protein
MLNQKELISEIDKSYKNVATSLDNVRDIINNKSKSLNWNEKYSYDNFVDNNIKMIENLKTDYYKLSNIIDKK